MTDLAAIRARHAGRHVCGGSDGHVAIYDDGRCDTAIVLAALDDFQRQCIGQGEAVIAAEQREARLWATLEYIAHLHETRTWEAPGLARTALAQVGSEGTDA
jgi:hypothetical protein